MLKCCETYVSSTSGLRACHRAKFEHISSCSEYLIYNLHCVCRYIGNLPPGVTVSQLADFLNAALKQLGVAKETGSVVSCWVSGDGHYGFAELRTVEECNAALAYLNGVQIGINLIKVGRPKGYLGPNGMPVAVAGVMPPGGLLGGMMNPVTGMMGLPTAPNPMMAGIGMLGAGSTESHSNVVMVSNLPMGITDDQVRELVSPFGTVCKGSYAICIRIIVARIKYLIRCDSATECPLLLLRFIPNRMTRCFS